MKIGIYDPYLHILGGAERYILTIALLLRQNHEIILFNGNESLLEKAEKKFGFKLPNLKTYQWSNNRIDRNKMLSKLDMFFYVTDGSIFWSPAKLNILLIQSPIHIPKNNVLNKIKLISWQKIICYSNFMVDIISKRLYKKAENLFVPVNQVNYIPKNKQKLIISVGRFFPNLHNKKQLEMVSFYKQMIKNGLINTKLILLGSIDPGGEKYFNDVKQAAYGLPVEIITNASYEQLIHYYSIASVYWHAAGYGEDLDKYPEKAEHFGVSTIEAMSYGCVPIVFAGGGQLEIVKNEVNGFLWKEAQELISETNYLLNNEVSRYEISMNAIKSATNYDMEKFKNKLFTLLKLK